MTPEPTFNPFAQSPYYWKVAFALPASAAQAVEQSFDDMALSISAFETDEKNHVWACELLCDAVPDMEEIERRVLVLSAVHRFPAPALSMERLEQKDWLGEVARSFPPVSAGRFYIYGSHVTAPTPASRIAIKIDAGAAFGSGEHGTTGTCLEALDWLARKRDFRRVLDMGCGSGILAIAAAKLWHADILAADIDPVAVAVTKQNARTNRVHMEAVVSDGYASDRIKHCAPYDLIVCNILARPLVKFAPALARHLAADGIAVLSGLLASQEAQIKNVHTAQDLKCIRRFADGDWRTLVLGR